MPSPPEQSALNLEQARALRADGCSYREIKNRLALTSGQLSPIRRALKREKAAGTRLRSRLPQATDRDLPIAQSVLPSGLRKSLVAAGFRTFGDLADRLAEPDFAGLVTLPGIGPHRVQLIHRLLDHFGLLPGSSDLKGAIERLFPELGEE